MVPKKYHQAHRHAWIQRLDQPVRVGGREVGEDNDKGEDELEAEVGHACLLELVVGPVDPVHQGRTRDGPTALGAHIQGGSERWLVDLLYCGIIMRKEHWWQRGRSGHCP